MVPLYHKSKNDAIFYGVLVFIAATATILGYCVANS